MKPKGMMSTCPKFTKYDKRKDLWDGRGLLGGLGWSSTMDSKIHGEISIFGITVLVF